MAHLVYMSTTMLAYGLQQPCTRDGPWVPIASRTVQLRVNLALTVATTGMNESLLHWSEVSSFLKMEVKNLRLCMETMHTILFY